MNYANNKIDDVYYENNKIRDIYIDTHHIMGTTFFPLQSYPYFALSVDRSYGNTLYTNDSNGGYSMVFGVEVYQTSARQTTRGTYSISINSTNKTGLITLSGGSDILISADIVNNNVSGLLAGNYSISVKLKNSMAENYLIFNATLNLASNSSNGNIHVDFKIPSQTFTWSMTKAAVNQYLTNYFISDLLNGRSCNLYRGSSSSNIIDTYKIDTNVYTSFGNSTVSNENFIISFGPVNSLLTLLGTDIDSLKDKFSLILHVDSGSGSITATNSQSINYTTISGNYYFTKVVNVLGKSTDVSGNCSIRLLFDTLQIESYGTYILRRSAMNIVG